MFLKKNVLIFVTFFVLFLFCVPSFLANLGHLYYLASFNSVTLNAQKNKILIKSLEYGKWAVFLAPSKKITRWQLGKTALALGDYELAAESLALLTNEVGRDYYLYRDLLISTSRSGRSETTIRLYEEYGNPFSQSVVSDTVAVAYLQLSEEFIEREQLDLAESFLESANALRVGDLYTTYYLLLLEKKRGNDSAVTSLSEILSHFPIEAVHPTDERLVTFASSVIPKLLEQKIWDEKLGLNVLSFWVWQQTNTQGVEELALLLTRFFPEQSKWRFLLAELYQRDNRLDEAWSEYQVLLEQDSTYSQVYFRLGIICETMVYLQSGDCTLETALKWYQRYYQMAPKDLAVLKKLEEFKQGKQLRTPKTKSTFTTENSTENLLILSDLLDVPSEDIVLNEMVYESFGNVGFEGQPVSWSWLNMATGKPWNAGTFAGGPDSKIAWDRQSVRISGMWLSRNPHLESARWGIRSQSYNLEPNSWYMISFFYRTDYLPDQSFVLYISDNTKLSFYGNGYPLPATDGEWRQIIVVGGNPTNLFISIAPILYSFAEGQIWIDEFYLGEIVLTNGLHRMSKATWKVLPE